MHQARVRAFPVLLLLAIAAALGACQGAPGGGDSVPASVLAPAPKLTDEFATTGARTATPAASLRGRYITARLKGSTWMRAAPGGKRVRRVGARTEFGSRNVLSVLERRDGWLKVISSRLPNHRTAWIPERRALLRSTNYSLHVDRSRRTLVLRHRDRELRRMPIAVGRPGNETPLGRFAVTDKLHPAEPSSPYGCCALALTGHQTKLVPGWPGGDRLAVHGTPAVESIGQAVSLGCMRAPESDLRYMLDQRAARHAGLHPRLNRVNAVPPSPNHVSAVPQSGTTFTRFAVVGTSVTYYRTTAPWDSNGTRMTSAQPSQCSCRRALTRPVVSSWHQTSTDGPAPEIVAPSAPSPAACSSSAADRGNSGARWGWCSAVGKAARDQLRVAALEPQHQQRDVADVEHRVGHTARRREAPPARRRCAPPRAGPRAAPRASAAPSMRSARPSQQTRSRRAARRRRCRDGPRAPSRARARRRRARTASRRPAGRPRTAAALVPSPPISGTAEPIRNSKSSAGCSASKPRTHRLRRSGAIARACRRRTRPSPRPRARRAATSAAASTSNPGPRLADEAGTRTTRRRFTAPPSPLARPRRCRPRTARPRRPARARSAGP